jgi:hypothetical protein
MTRLRLPRRCSTLTAPLPRLPLLRLIPLAMVVRAKDMVVTIDAIARIAEATVAADVATLPTRETRARAANPGLPSWPSFYNPWSKTINMHYGPTPGGAATPPSAATGSHHYAWTNHGRPSIHTTLSVDPSSTTDVRRPVAAGHFYILDVVAHHVGPAIAGQLLQHDDAPDTALTYGVGH